MKKHQILSLLLALVLVFSAAGTAFAAMDAIVTVPGYGKMTCTSSYDSTAKEIYMKTSIVSGDKNMYLRNGVIWYLTEDKPVSDIPAWYDGTKGGTTLNTTVPVDYALGWDPVKVQTLQQTVVLSGVEPVAYSHEDSFDL